MSYIVTIQDEEGNEWWVDENGSTTPIKSLARKFPTREEAEHIAKLKNMMLGDGKKAEVDER